MANNIIGIVGAVLSSICVVTGQAWIFYVGRMISGFSCGISIGVASMYLTEIAPRQQRGIIGACHQLAVTLGIAFVYVATLDSTLNQANLWPVAVGIGALPPLVSFCVMLALPESPRFLYLVKGNEAEARKAYARLSGAGGSSGSAEDVELFIAELNQEKEAAARLPEFKFLQLFTRKDLRMAVAIACIMQIIQQGSGINAVSSLFL